MNQTLIITGQLILAILFGWLIGFERERSGKSAGTRTYALVTFGSALFTIVSLNAFNDYAAVDPTRMISQIIVGIGFIGAGMIILDKHKVEGLTTAAALWASSSIGITIGIGWYLISVIATLLILILLYVVGHLEHDLLRKKSLLSRLNEKIKNKL
jgi:putative Mg2+ transporter-C (MgtC) family protein